MIPINRTNTGYTPPRPNVTASTLAPLSGARGNMGQLQSSLAYQQAGMEGKRQMEQNVDMGRPVGVRDVARYEQDLEQQKMREAAALRVGQGMPQLAQAKKNFETNVF